MKEHQVAAAGKVSGNREAAPAICVGAAPVVPQAEVGLRNYLHTAGDDENGVIPGIEKPAVKNEAGIAPHTGEIYDQARRRFTPDVRVGEQRQRIPGKALHAGDGRIADAGIGCAIAPGHAVGHTGVGIAGDGGDGRADPDPGPIIRLPDGGCPVGAGPLGSGGDKIGAGVACPSQENQAQNAADGRDGEEFSHNYAFLSYYLVGS